MPDSDKLSGIFLINYNISKYRHLPDKSYGYTVGTVIFLSQYFGTGSEIIGSSHIGEEEVQIGFHRIILYTGEVAPGSAIITSGYPSVLLVTEAVSYIPFTNAFHLGQNR